MASAVFSEIDIGTSFVITIGAGGAGGAYGSGVGDAGGTTSFGTVMSGTGGGSGGPSGKGTITVGAGGSMLVYEHNRIQDVFGSPYGAGGPASSAVGFQGCVLIEW
jgi:hypothetical protein